MRYVALATDYDGTLATNGVVSDSTLAALERFAASGRKLVLVTGRTLDELAQAFAHLEDLRARRRGERRCPLHASDQGGSPPRRSAAARVR